jgi:hypothetical protein
MRKRCGARSVAQALRPQIRRDGECPAFAKRFINAPGRRASTLRGNHVCSTIFVLGMALCAQAAITDKPQRIDIQQVPTCSEQDMTFFLHGSMSTEVVPERGLSTPKGAWRSQHRQIFRSNINRRLGTFAIFT